MSYGTNDGVAAFTPRYANASGRFDNTTTPTAAQVEAWRTQVSAMLDVALAAAGLPSPASEASVTAMLAGFVNGNVAWLAESVNGQGRFQERPATTQEILSAIGAAAEAFVRTHALGIGAKSGVAQDDGVGAGAGARVIRRVDDYSRVVESEYAG